MGMLNRKKYAGLKPGTRIKYTTDTGAESCAKQEFREATDINAIMRRFAITGQLPQLNVPGTFADVSEVGDFRDALERVNKGREAFAALPPELRLKFNNDPAQLIEFIQDHRNLDEAVKLGLLIKREESPAAPGDTKPESTPKA